MTKVCFCGIAGSGMNPLAQIMKRNGYEVIGTDRAFDLGEAQDIKENLISLGIEIRQQDGSAISDDVSTLYISTAVEDHIPDIKIAKEKNIEIKTRPELLADIFNKYKYNIAIGGTSGKTTTTAMVGYILNELGKEPLVINGSILKNYGSSLIYHNKDICVIEADESNGSITLYNPYITLINNISIDHKPLEEIKEIFQEVAHKASFGLVLNKDCPNSKEIENKKIKTTYFSIKDSSADFYAYDIKNNKNEIEYNLAGKKFKLQMIGSFNVENALAAIAICSFLGIDKFESAKTLEGFLGTKRRLEIIGEKNNITVINDFSHNPEKVLAAVSALKKYAGRLIIMFQPHGLIPARLYGKEIIESFAKTLDKNDILLMTELFRVDIKESKLSSEDFVNQAKELGVNAIFTQTKEKTKEYILRHAKSGDRIIIMGARDTGFEILCKEILENV